jgi:hypothetical protein
MKQLVHL